MLWRQLPVQLSHFVYCIQHNYCTMCLGFSKLLDAIQMGTLDICLYNEVDKKYASYNQETTKLLYLTVCL